MHISYFLISFGVNLNLCFASCSVLTLPEKSSWAATSRAFARCNVLLKGCLWGTISFRWCLFSVSFHYNSYYHLESSNLYRLQSLLKSNNDYFHFCRRVLRIGFCSLMLLRMIFFKELYWHVLLILKILICLCMGHVCIHKQYHFLSFMKKDIWMCSLFQIGMLYSLKTKLQLKLSRLGDMSPNCPYFKDQY